MKIKKILYFFIFALLIMGCQSYEQGPSFTLRSVKSRLIGKWKIEDVLISDRSNAELLKKESNYEYEFKNNGELLIKLNNINLKENSIIKAEWELNDKKTEIEIEIEEESIENLNNSLEFNDNGMDFKGRTFTILKLSNKELWVTSTRYFSNTKMTQPIAEHRYVKVN